MINLGRSWKILIPFVTLVILAACQVPTPPVTPPPPPTSTNLPPTSTPIGGLPFETIAIGSGYHAELIGFDICQEDRIQAILVNQAEGIARVVELMRSEYDSQAIKQVDFADHFVIGVFRNPKGNGCYDVIIRSVVDKDEGLEVNVDLVEPGGIYRCADIEMTPFHIVQVKRESQELTPNEDDIILKPVRVTTTPYPTRPIRVLGPTPHAPCPTPQK